MQSENMAVSGCAAEGIKHICLEAPLLSINFGLFQDRSVLLADARGSFIVYTLGGLSPF